MGLHKSVVSGSNNVPLQQRAVTNELLTFDPAVSPASGTTTAIGTNATLIDNTRTEATNHWNGQLILITSGVNTGQVREIVTWNLPAFTFTVSPVLEVPVIAGITYQVLSTLAADIETADLQANLGTIADVEVEAGTTLARLLWIKNGIRRGTGTILPVNTSLYDHISRVLCSMDFWGDIIEELQLTSALQANLALGGNVVIAGLPASATLVRVVVMFMCRAIENTNAAANKLQDAQNIEVNFGGGAFIDAIPWADDLFAVALSTREMGTALVGSIDVKATVTGNGTCTFRIDAARADQNNLNFNDYQVGVRVYFTV